MSTRIVATGLEDFGDFLELAPEVVPMAARMAINDVAKRSGINLARREIMEQVNFPSGYLSNDRLFVAKLARDDDLEKLIALYEKLEFRGWLRELKSTGKLAARTPTSEDAALLCTLIDGAIVRAVYEGDAAGALAALAHGTRLLGR